MSMLKSLNVATPFTALTVVVPRSVPPLGFVPITTVMLVVAPWTVFPDMSCTTTRTSGAPAANAFMSGPLKLSCEAIGPVELLHATAPRRVKANRHRTVARAWGPAERVVGLRNCPRLRARRGSMPRSMSAAPTIEVSLMVSVLRETQ